MREIKNSGLVCERGLQVSGNSLTRDDKVFWSDVRAVYSGIII